MNKKLLLIGTIIALIAISCGIYIHYKRQQTKSNYTQAMQTAMVLPEARNIAAFSLMNNKGKIYTNKNLLGHWSMFFFGFTSCKSICPTTMNELKNMTELLKKENIKPPQVILVSIDPKRDTVDRLNTYVTRFNQNFVGLTGLEPKINAFAKDMHVMYVKIEMKDKGKNYDMDHSGTILLINPEGKLKAIFSMPHDSQQMAHDFALIQKYA